MENEDMVSLAIKIERQLKEKSLGYNSKPYSSFTSSWKLNWSKKDDKTIVKPKMDETKSKTELGNKKKSENQPTQTRALGILNA